MSKIKKLLTPRVTMGLFVLALILLLLSSVSGTRAALTYFSDDYTTAMATQHIGVALLENGNVVSTEIYGSDDETGSRELLQKVPTDKKDINIGAPYEEELRVRNVGTIGQYVRVTVYRYWTDENGNKLANLNPEFIGLDFKDGEDNWVIDEKASTPERTVLYYTVPLAPDTSSEPLATTLILDPEINNVVTWTEEDGVRTSTYDYNEKQFHLDAVVDAVQNHNADAAAKSIWGVDLNDVF